MAVVPFVQASVAFLLVADRLLSRHGSPCPLLLSPSFIEQTYNAVSTCSSCNAATGDSEGVGADRHWCGEKGGLVLGRVRGAHLRESLLPHPGQGRDASFCRDTPYLVITSIAYTEHVGVNLQLGGNIGEIK